MRISFADIPVQSKITREYRFNSELSGALNAEVQSLMDRGIVLGIPKGIQPKFVSNVFLRPKPNGKFRLILDLSTLNDDVIKKHFKMSFPWQGTLYQFNALPFSLTSAPRIFTK